MNFVNRTSLWRGGLSECRTIPFECAALANFGSAARPNGGKPPRHRVSIHSVVFVLSLFSLSACTVGPDFQKPQPQQVAEWSKPTKAAASQIIPSEMNERWWEIFHDPNLSALTQRALTDNLDLKLASSRLQQSRAARQVITANRYPDTAATGSYGRKRNSGEGLNLSLIHI